MDSNEEKDFLRVDFLKQLENCLLQHTEDPPLLFVVTLAFGNARVCLRTHTVNATLSI